MRSKSVAGALAAVAGVAAGCGSVAGGDASFWQPAQGVAGAQLQFITAPGGAAGYPAPPPTDTNHPPPPGAGGIPNAGGGLPFGGTPPNTGGVQPFGGAPPEAGGSFPVGGFGNTGGVQTTNTGGATTTPPGKCTFRFDVTTTSYGGRYGPANVGAIYIENASGGYVKSLNVWGWGGIRLGNLTDWAQLSGNDVTDAVTSATRRNGGPVSGSWDCTDHTRALVPAGQYKVCCSFQEDDALPFFGPAPKQVCVPFDVGSGPVTQNPPNQGNFTSMSLTMQ